MATYVRPSMSPAGLELTRDLFEALAKGAETFVFVYLGMAAVTFPIFHNTVWALAAATLVACLVGRLHVFVGAAVTNCVRRACRDRTRGTARTLNLKQSFCIWFSGLRGGVAFAIAAASYGDTDFPTRCAGWQPSSPGEPRPNPNPNPNRLPNPNLNPNLNPNPTPTPTPNPNQASRGRAGARRA